MFLWIPKGFISLESFSNFFINLYILPWLRKGFRFIVLRLLKIYFWIKIFKLFIFTHALKHKSPQVFIIIPQADGNCPFLPNSVFPKMFFPEQKKEKRIMESKKWPKLTRVLATSFDKFHHLCNRKVFGFIFVLQQFSFKHAEVRTSST